MKTGIISSCMRRAIPSLTLCTWLFSEAGEAEQAALLLHCWAPSRGAMPLEVSCSMQSSARRHRQTCTPQQDSSHAQGPCLKPVCLLLQPWAVGLPGFSKGCCSCSKCLGASQQQAGASTDSQLWSSLKEILCQSCGFRQSKILVQG